MPGPPGAPGAPGPPGGVGPSGKTGDRGESVSRLLLRPLLDQRKLKLGVNLTSVISFFFLL